MLKIIIVLIFALMAVVPSFAMDKNPITNNSFNSQLGAMKIELSEMPNSKYISQYQLTDLLKDRDPEVRKIAVKNSKTIISNSTVYRTVIDIFEDDSERLDIRIEAAKALSYGAGASTIVSELTNAVKYENDPKELKIMTYKALWNAARARSTTRSFLVSALKYDEKDIEIRKAIIWSLFASSKNSRVYGVLVDLLKYGKDDNSTKIEAIKSLYGAMGQSRVKGLMIDIAKYKTSTVDKELRKTAILALSAVNGDSRVKYLLEDLFKRDKDIEIRTVALEAASGDKFKMNEFFHLNYKLENGGVYNPIEKE